MTTSHYHQGSSGSDAVADLAREHPSLVTLAKAGWAAKGVVYAIIGILAVPIALNGFDREPSSASGSAEGQASQSGAVAEIAEQPLGSLALWLVGIGLALYVIWRLFSIALPAENSAKVWLVRVGYAISAAVYASLAWSAISLATGRSGSGSENEESRVDRVTREVMEMTGGRLLVGLAGAAIIVVGAVFVHRGATAGFRDELEAGGVGPIDHETLVRLGQVGWIGRGVMMVLVGWFVAQAAVNFDPDEANGIDGALREATGSTLGAVLVLVVAVGLIVYGAFCVLSAPRARLKGAD